VICTPCREFTVLNDYRLGPRDFRPFTIVDGWRLLDVGRLAKEIKYVTPGRLAAEAAPAAPRRPRRAGVVRP
jgi:hypothetical protein